MLAEWHKDGAEVAVVVAICKRWVKDIIALTLPARWWIELTDLPAGASLQQALRASGKDSLADAFEFSVVTREGHPPQEVSIVHSALATACGQLLVEHGPEGLEWIRSLEFHADSRHWDEFINAAVSAATGNAHRTSAIIAHARRLVTEMIAGIEEGTERSSSGEDLRAQLERYRAGTSFESVWNSPDFHVELRHVDLLEVVARIDRDAFIAIIEALPHPGLVRQCFLSQREFTQLPALAALLPRLAYSLDSCGACRNSGQAATEVLHLATNALLVWGDQAEEFVGNRKDFESWQDVVFAQEDKACKEFCQSLTEAVFARVDSQYLGWPWLAEVLKYAAPSRRGGTRTRLLNKPLLLAQAIVKQLRPRTDALKWVQEPRPGERQYRVAAVLWVASSTNDFDSEWFESLATQLVKASAQDLSNVAALIGSQDAVFSRAIGIALSRDPDFSGWISRCWKGVRFEREMAWRSRGRSESSNPAEVLLIYGISTLSLLLLDSATNSAAITATWRELNDIICEGRLVERSYDGDGWTRAIEWLFAAWLKAFPEDAQKTALTNGHSTSTRFPALSDSVAPYVGVDNDFLAVLTGLSAGGVTFEQIAAACSELNCDLEGYLKRFAETRRAPGRANKVTARYMAQADAMLRSAPARLPNTLA